MKRETREAKLAALLGLAEVHEAVKEKKQNLNRPIAIEEDRIQDFRAAQGLSYFLQAPALFTAKVCGHCKETFLVSRQFVKFCSYTCISKDLEERGVKWSKNEQFEALANDPQVYNGNEPIWIRKPEQLMEALRYLESQLSQANTSNPVPS